MKKHYKPDSERKKQISASILPANVDFLMGLAISSGMNNFSAALDETITKARKQAAEKVSGEYGTAYDKAGE